MLGAMSDGFLHSPFPIRSSSLYVYATASEVLGQQIPKEARITLWERIPQEQALYLIAQILTDTEIGATQDGVSKSDVDKRWTAFVRNNHLRTRLTIASTLGVTVFAPQLLLLAADEVLSHCPGGPPNDTLDGLDDLIMCLLGIGDDSPAGESSEAWGGMGVALAGEIIANLHFNRTMWLAHQLSWFDRVWFQDWPKKTSDTVTVGGEPSELFKEATGIELADFGAVAFNVYAQSATHQFVRFPQEFFETLGIETSAVEHFLKTTSRTVLELREEIELSAAAAGSSRYGFDAFRRFHSFGFHPGRFLFSAPTSSSNAP